MRIAILSLLVLTAGCGDSAQSPPDAAPADIAHVIPAVCSGSLSGGTQMSFMDCQLSISRTEIDDLFRLAPTNVKGDVPLTIEIGAFVKGHVHAQGYSLADLEPGSKVDFTMADQHRHWLAQKDDVGVVTGDMTLTFYTPPTAPDGGTDRIDTSVHGEWRATLQLDPNSPASPFGNTVTFDALF